MQANYAAIPIRAIPNQWVCWRYVPVTDNPGEFTKPPYNPRTGKLAAVDDPSSWVSFDDACNAAIQNPSAYNGVGVVLKPENQLTIIDIDLKKVNDPAIVQSYINLVAMFDSYTEYSPSGKGFHIYVMGQVPNGGVRSKYVEMYSANHYMTCTGVSYVDKPIAERQSVIDAVYQHIMTDRNKAKKSNGAGVAVEYVNEQMLYEDTIIVEKCKASRSFGERFTELFAGRWEQYKPDPYPSQSEADQGLMNMFVLYTRNREQIIRLFLSSGLGQRDKARKRKDYIEATLNKAFDQVVNPAEIQHMQKSVGIFQTEAPGADTATGGSAAINPNFAGHAQLDDGSPLAGRQSIADHFPVTQANTPVNPYVKPPGLMGYISDFIYAAAQTPFPQSAIAAAIGLMAGICGRAYNTSTGSGLNMYVLCIAETGVGKEAIKGGVTKLCKVIAELTPKSKGTIATPSVMEFIGLADYQSHQALVKSVTAQPCQVALVGEFGLLLKQIASDHAPQHLQGMLRRLLDFFSLSGVYSIGGGLKYSQKQQDTGDIIAPAFSILGETTPDAYYQAISRDLVSKGLVPRFLCLEYFGERNRRQRGAADVYPQQELVNAISSLAVSCHTAMQKQDVIRVKLDEQSEFLSDQYDEWCEQQRRNAPRTDDATKQLWTRAHLKTLKLASLVAVGVNPSFPTITPDVWQWAERIVTADVINVIQHFEAGIVGIISENRDQEDSLIRVILDYVNRPYSELKKWIVVDEGEAYHAARFIPKSYLTVRLQHARGFATAKDYRKEMFGVLRDFEDRGIIRSERANKLPQPYEFKSHGVVYWIADIEMFKQHYGKR